MRKGVYRGKNAYCVAGGHEGEGKAEVAGEKI